jgi:hypothetical protein
VGLGERLLGVQQGQLLLGVGQPRLLLGPLPEERPQGHQPDGDKEEGGLLGMAGRSQQNGNRGPKAPAKIQNPEKLKDPKYALALHIARMRRERRAGMPPGPMPPMR